MADFEQTLREIFGDSINKVDAFRKENMDRMKGKLGELARDAVRDDMAKLTAEVQDLRARVAALEAERINAVEDVGN